MIHVKTFSFNYLDVNTYLLFDETGEAAIIDCGCMNRKEEDVLASAIRQGKLVLKKLLTTHYHFDHIIGNAFIYNNYGIRPEFHEDEVGKSTPSLNAQAASFGLFTMFQEVLPEHYIKNDEEISFGRSMLKAIPVGGHSPASLAYYSEVDKMVFVGDALFQGSIGRTDLWGGNHETLINNIVSNLFTLPDDTVVYPGHGESTTIGDEKRYNPYIGSWK